MSQPVVRRAKTGLRGSVCRAAGRPDVSNGHSLVQEPAHRQAHLAASERLRVPPPVSSRSRSRTSGPLSGACRVGVLERLFLSNASALARLPAHKSAPKAGTLVGPSSVVRPPSSPSAHRWDRLALAHLTRRISSGAKIHRVRQMGRQGRHGQEHEANLSPKKPQKSRNNRRW